jgi:hypothetical protein
MNAKSALETELQDTKARIDELQEDLDELRGVSPDAWWDVSSERVGEYIEASRRRSSGWTTTRHRRTTHAADLRSNTLR